VKRPKRNLKWWLRAVYLGLKHPGLVFIKIHYAIARSVSDFLARLNYYDYPHKVIFLAGMPMSGTTWVKGLVAQMPGYHSRPSKTPYEIGYRQDISAETFRNVPKHAYTLFKTHMNPKPENLKILSDNGVDKVVITYRDLRDVVVSRYYRLVDSPKPDNAPDKVDYLKLSKEEAINDSIEKVGTHYVPWIKDWKKLADENPEKYMLVKYEEMKKDTKRIFKEILAFYNIKLEEQKIEAFLENAKGKKSFKKNNEASMILPFGISSNFRSGKSGHWKEELTGPQIEKCKEYMGGILIELGYEENLNWEL